jgi:beta-glucanase (GH16 family)
MIAMGLVLSLMTGLAPQGAIGQISPAIAGNWSLIFHDEFSGTALDRTKWRTTFPWNSRTIAANHELEYYTDDAFQVTDGVLCIRAERRTTHGFRYTSGMVTSFASFDATYGYFEIRAKIPKGHGLWPAFWLAPQDTSWPPEIDIFELMGDKPNMNYMANHYATEQGPRQTRSTWTGPDFSQGFHTFGLEWSPTRIIWYIDGLERFRTSTHIPVKPMYMILDLAVGGDWVGSPDSATRFPSYLDVAYIRVYERP